jgi:hypothetical protein
MHAYAQFTHTFAFHDTPLGGHSGVQATYIRIKKLFYWKGLKGDADNFVK